MRVGAVGFVGNVPRDCSGSHSRNPESHVEDVLEHGFQGVCGIGNNRSKSEEKLVQADFARATDHMLFSGRLANVSPAANSSADEAEACNHAHPYRWLGNAANASRLSCDAADRDVR